MVFILRDDLDIQRCCLCWYNFGHSVAKDVNRWIIHAVKRNVHEMSIKISKDHHSSYEVPHQLLNCASLRMLELKVFGNARYANVVLPRSINLPQLRVLGMIGCSISDVESSKRLFSSCPVLETLCIYDCDIQTGNQRDLTVDLVSLKRFEYACYLKHLTMILWLTLSSSVLQIWKYSVADLSLQLSRVTLCMMLQAKEEHENAEAYLKLPSEETDVYAKRVMKFLGAVYMVKDLSLSSGFLEVLSQALGKSDCQSHRLCNLQYLKVDMWFTRGCLRSVAYLLSISPYIASIYLTSKESNLADAGDNWEAGFSLPGMLSHLKYVKIKEVEGCDNELKFLDFLLKNASVLKKVVLYPRSTIDSPDGVRKHFQDRLRAIPRASSRVIMHWIG